MPLKKYIYLFLTINLCYFANSQNLDLAKSDSVKYYLGITDKLNQEHNYNEALQFAEKAKNYAFRNSKNKEIAQTYYVIGSIKYNIKELKDAENILLRAASISEIFNKDILGLVNYKLGLVYSDLKDEVKAEKYFFLAEKSFEKNKVDIENNSNITKIDKANLYLKLNKIDKAKKIYINVINQPEITKQTIEAYVNLSNLISKDSVDWVIASLKNIEINDFDLNSEIKNTLYCAIADLSVKNDSPYIANHYYKKYIDLNKSEQKKFNSPNITALNEVISKENQENKNTNDKAVKFTKLISIMSIALIAILSLLSISLYRNNKDRMLANKLLQNKNNELEIEKNKAEKASKARTEFLSTVSHELRTPLNAINGITHILLEENPKESQLQYLKSLEFSGDYLLRFINDILEINRVESGNVELEEINYDLRQLLENILESFSEISKKNEVTCLLDIDSKIPAVLIGDPTKLSQIFMNLIGNSMKFANKGNIWVRVKKLSITDTEVELYMEIKDNGIGISEEKQKNIFENFTQGSVEINRKYGGTGLGLAIVKSLIELIGGNIQLKSTLGVGSKFFFTIKQKIGEKTELIPVKANYEESILEGKHVLIVEDNKINQMITEKMLAKKQMTYVTIDNGEDAIVAAKENTFDLILMDIHLPGINGTIAAEEIRKFDTNTPIIALTAISLNENRELLLSYGMNEVITKPFQPEKFYEAISLTINESITSK